VNGVFSGSGGSTWSHRLRCKARSDGQPLLVTSGKDGRTGIEVRTPTLGLEATGRIEGPVRSLGATGWDRHVAALGVTLHLPPGHRLLAAFGTDGSSQSWAERWRLLDMFVVLLVTAVAFRVAGVRVAAVALAALVLAHQEWPVLTWATLNLLIATALVRVAPRAAAADRTDLARGRPRDRRRAVRAVCAEPGAARVLPAARKSLGALRDGRGCSRCSRTGGAHLKSQWIASLQRNS
jgi:hypothetical protein